MEPQKETVTTTVNADIDKVWKYYTTPEHITNWNFANDKWHCPSAENDLKPGGKYTARMENVDGSFGFDFEAIYDEIIENKKIVYTIIDGRQAVILFEETGDNTTVTITFELEKINPRDMQKRGWQLILDNFKNYTENN